MRHQKDNLFINNSAQRITPKQTRSFNIRAPRVERARPAGDGACSSERAASRTEPHCRSPQRPNRQTPSGRPDGSQRTEVPGTPRAARGFEAEGKRRRRSHAAPPPKPEPRSRAHLGPARSPRPSARSTEPRPLPHRAPSAPTHHGREAGAPTPQRRPAPRRLPRPQSRRRHGRRTRAARRTACPPSPAPAPRTPAPPGRPRRGPPRKAPDGCDPLRRPRRRARPSFRSAAARLRAASSVRARGCPRRSGSTSGSAPRAGTVAAHSRPL